jgi:hypothetical protein
MAIAGALEIQMFADIARISDDMRKAKDVVGSAMGSVEKSVESAKKALELLGVGLGMREIKEFVAGIIEAGDKVYLMSQKIGISVEILSSYQLAAKQSGVEIDSFGKGIKNLSVYMAKHDDELKSLGVTSKDTNIAFKQLADVFQALPDGYQKTALAQEIFKKSGIEMIPMLNKGSEGLQEAADKSALYTEKMALLAPIAHEFNDRLEELKISSGGLGNTIGLSLLPVMNAVIEQFMTAREKSDGLTMGFDPLGEAAKAIVVLFGNVVYVLTQTGNTIGAVFAEIAAISTGDFAGAKAISSALKKDGETARADFDAWETKMMAIKTGMAAVKTESAQGTSKTAEQIKALQDTIASLLSKGGPSDALQKAFEGAMNAMGGMNAAAQAQIDWMDKYGVSVAYGSEALMIFETTMGKFADLSDPQKAMLVNAAKLKDQLAANKKQAEDFYKFEDELRKKDQADEEKYQQEKWQTVHDATQSLVDATALINANMIVDDTARNAALLAIEKNIWTDKIGLAVAGSDEQKAIQQAYTDWLAAKAAQQDQTWGAGAVRAVQEYFNEIGNGAKQAGTIFSGAFKSLEDTLTNFFTTGKLNFSSFVDYIKQALARLAAQQFIINIAGAVGITGTSGVAGAASSANGLLSTGSMANSAYNWATGGTSATNYALGAYNYATGGAATGAGIAGMTGAATSTTALTSSTMGLAATGGGDAALAGLGATGWGLIAVAAIAVIGYLSKDAGPADRTGNWVGGLGDPTSSTNNHWFTDSAAMKTDTASTSLQTAEQAMITSLGLTADQIAKINTNISALSGKQYGFGLENGDQQAGTNAAMQQIIHDRMQAVADALGESLNKLVLDITFNFTKNAEQYTKLFGAPTDTAAIEGAAHAGETVITTMQRLIPVFQVTNTATNLLGIDTAKAFGAVGVASADMRQKMIDSAGGMANFAAQTQYLSSNFTTDAAQKAQTASAATATLTQAFGDLGLAVPQTHQEFLDLAASMLDGTDAGQAANQSILNVSSAFVTLHGTAQQAADALKATTKSIADSLDALNGGHANNQILAQSDLNSSMALVTAAMPWITTFEQLSTITMEDASHYSAANQILIGNALSAGVTLHDLTNSSSTAAAAVTQMAQAAQAATVDMGTILASAKSMASNIVDTIGGAMSGASFTDKTSAQMAGLNGLITQLIGQRHSGMQYAEDLTREQAIVDARNALEGLGSDLARYVVLEAQYSGHGQQLLELEKWDEQQLDLYHQSGIDTIALQAEYERKRLEIINGGNSSATGALTGWAASLQTWLTGLTAGALSPLTEQQKFDQAQQAYVENLLLAQGGDATAQAAFQADAQAYLTEAKAMYGFGGDYSSIFQSVLEQGQNLITPTTTAAQQTTVAIQALTAEVFDLKATLARIAEQGNAQATEQAQEIVAAITDSGTTQARATTQAAAIGSTA